MKVLMAAFSITLLFSVTIYGSLRLFAGLEGEAVFAVASFPFLASGHIFEILERRSTKEKMENTPNKAITDFPKFGLPWYKFTIFSFLFIVATAEAFGAYLGVAFAFADAKLSMIFIGLLDLPVISVTMFMAGRWLGSRCRNVAVGMFLFSFITTIFIISDHVVVETFIADDPDSSLGDGFGTLWSPQFFFTSISGIGIYSIVGCLGLWRGSRMRTEKYLEYLTKIMPKSSKLALVDLAYDEVVTTLQKKHGAPHSNKE